MCPLTTCCIYALFYYYYKQTNPYLSIKKHQHSIILQICYLLAIYSLSIKLQTIFQFFNPNLLLLDTRTTLWLARIKLQSTYVLCISQRQHFAFRIFLLTEDAIPHQCEHLHGNPLDFQRFPPPHSEPIYDRIAATNKTNRTINGIGGIIPADALRSVLQYKFRALRRENK